MQSGVRTLMQFIATLVYILYYVLVFSKPLLSLNVPIVAIVIVDVSGANAQSCVVAVQLISLSWICNN